MSSVNQPRKARERLGKRVENPENNTNEEIDRRAVVYNNIQQRALRRRPEDSLAHGFLCFFRKSLFKITYVHLYRDREMIDDIDDIDVDIYLMRDMRERKEMRVTSYR